MGARWKCGVVGSCLILGLGVALAVAADAPAPAPAGPAAAPALPKCAYVGVSGCRICHNSKTQGEQYGDLERDETRNGVRDAEVR